MLMILNREIQILELKMNIQMKTREDLSQQQREYFLQQQIKTIGKSWAENPTDRDRGVPEESQNQEVEQGGG